MFGSALQDAGDCGHSPLQRLVLPQADHLPTSLCESNIRGTVTFDVPAKLWRPIPFVGRRIAAMLWANMPEAAVDEDRDLSSREDDVGPDLYRSEVESEIFAIPIPQPMQCAPQRNLRLGVGSAVSSHVPGTPLVEGGRIEATVVGLPPSFFRSFLSHICPSSRQAGVVRKDTPAHTTARPWSSHRKASA